MRHVNLVTKHQLERVRAERESDLCLSLSRSEVQVIEVIGNRLVQRRQRGIDHKMVVPGIGLFDACGRYAHVDETEADNWCAGYVGAIGWVYKIDLRVSSRGMSTGSSSCRGRARFDDADP